ncbi:hypothetical protein O8B93_20095 [Agrobacterium rhizogenes]|uniref:hypothetical protein n=1 Tax=Rhizobium rhizogenes TaxID=359 RepID=UPI0022B68211|nr:hypothetical protein [Rhizobium rhizogenes]MCZ7449890.1 hypothetical protein [Rhizobium rhizogenes]
MLWNLEKIEKERTDLIEVITGLTRLERLQQIDRNILSVEIAAHMTRLSELDAERQRCGLLQSQIE